MSIFSEERRRVERSYETELNNKKQTINSRNNDINRLKEEIESDQKTINGIDEKKRTFIYKLRNIMENEDNHENHLICEKLTEENERLYRNEIVNLNTFLNMEYKKKDNHVNNIENKREQIFKNKEDIRDMESAIENIYNEAIEDGRKKIIQSCIDYLVESKATKKHKAYLEEMLVVNANTNQNNNKLPEIK